MATWTVPQPQDTGAIISVDLWQSVVDNLTWLYDNYLMGSDERAD